MDKLIRAVALFATISAALAPGVTFGQTGERPDTAASRPGEAIQQDRLAVSSKVLDAGKLLEDVRELSSDAMEGRKFGAPGGARARAYIARRFAEAGLKPFFDEGFEQPVRGRAGGQTIKGANIVGVVRGKSDPERFLVITAHYDHLGIKDGLVYNGADDNASGVAALIQIAAHLAKQQPANSIIFAAPDAEEAGAFAGSRTLVRALLAAKCNVVLNINLDMVGRSDRGELYACGPHHSPFLKPHVERIAERAPVKLLIGHDRPEQGADDWTNQSDHFAFHEKQIPFLYLGVENHEDYHQPTDDFETLTFEFFVRAAETVLDAVKALDAELPGIEKENRR